MENRQSSSSSDNDTSLQENASQVPKAAEDCFIPPDDLEDDERTIEEEEALEPEMNPSDEIKLLAKDMDMTVDEVLALSRSSRRRRPVRLPQPSTSNNASLPQPSTSKNACLLQPSTSKNACLLQASETKSDHPVVSDPTVDSTIEDTTSNCDPTSSGDDSEENDGVLKRFYLSKQLSDEDRSKMNVIHDSDDDEYLPPQPAHNVRLGPEFQVEVPTECLRFPNANEDQYSQEEVLWIPPTTIGENEIESYIRDAGKILHSDTNSTSTNPNCDNPKALFLLMNAAYNTNEAVRLCQEFANNECQPLAVGPFMVEIIPDADTVADDRCNQNTEEEVEERKSQCETETEEVESTDGEKNEEETDHEVDTEEETEVEDHEEESSEGEKKGVDTEQEELNNREPDNDMGQTLDGNSAEEGIEENGSETSVVHDSEEEVDVGSEPDMWYNGGNGEESNDTNGTIVLSDSDESSNASTESSGSSSSDSNDDEIHYQNLGEQPEQPDEENNSEHDDVEVVFVKLSGQYDPNIPVFTVEDDDEAEVRETNEQNNNDAQLRERNEQNNNKRPREEDTDEPKLKRPKQ